MNQDKYQEQKKAKPIILQCQNLYFQANVHNVCIFLTNISIIFRITDRVSHHLVITLSYIIWFPINYFNKSAKNISLFLLFHFVVSLLLLYFLIALTKSTQRFRSFLILSYDFT